MQYSWLPQERRELRIREKPPLVISLNRYARLQANAGQLARQEQQLQQQQRLRYEEQLRLGGEELLRKFDGRKLCRTQAEQCLSAQRREQTQQQEAKQRAQEEGLAERREEQQRQRARIEQAQLLLEQLRPGPRELHCAKLQSEVMRGVNAQRLLQTQFAAANEQQRTLDRRIYNEQVQNEIELAQTRHRQRRQQLNEHKRALLESIEAREQARSQAKAEQMEEALQERKRNQLQLQQQQQQESAAQAAQKQQRRQQVLAAKAAAEQREQRLRMLDEVEQLQCEIHNEAKAKLDKLKLQQAKQLVQRRLQRNEQLAQQLAPRLHYSASEDQARHERQLAELRRAHSVEEQTRRQRRAQFKAERQAMQRAEQQQAEAARQQAEQAHQESVARRLQNELIHVQFKRQQRQEQLRRQVKLCAELAKQQQQQEQELARPDINYNRQAQLECLREDAFFVEYAERLMTEASAQGCPLKPFVRAVAQYKSENRIGAGIRVPRHMITRLTMGRRTQGDSKAEKKLKQQQAAGEGVKEKTATEEEQYKQKIEESLKKIDALVLTEAKQKDEQNKAEKVDNEK